MSCNDIPPRAGVLYSTEVPPAGGNTSFANMYDALEAATRQRIEPLTWVHDASRNSVNALRRGFAESTDSLQTAGARHPVTGRRYLFPGRRRDAYNRCALHRRDDFDDRYERIKHRAQVKQGEDA